MKISALIRHWGLESAEIRQIQDCVWEISETYILKAYIELLFAAWFTGTPNIRCAEDAAKLFHFVQENETEIKRDRFKNTPKTVPLFLFCYSINPDTIFIHSAAV